MDSKALPYLLVWAEDEHAAESVELSGAYFSGIVAVLF